MKKLFRNLQNIRHFAMQALPGQAKKITHTLAKQLILNDF